MAKLLVIYLMWSASTVLVGASEQQERALRRYNENAWFVREAMAAGRWDEGLTAGITTLVKAATPDWDHANPSHSQFRGPELATKLRPWLEASSKLDPERRAAALLIADRIVVMEEEDGNLEPLGAENRSSEGEHPETRPKSSAQQELEKLGAQFSYNSAWERHLYTLNWLQQAYELDPEGRVGDLAFLLLMEKGFDLSPNCANGPDQFRVVIRRGEKYLRGRHSGDVEARVHFLLGDAYRDIVGLAANQCGDTYVDPNQYKPESTSARTNAIAEYRAGLALDGGSDISMLVKERLRSLEAGEAPHDVRFYCQMMD